MEVRQSGSALLSPLVAIVIITIAVIIATLFVFLLHLLRAISSLLFGKL